MVIRKLYAHLDGDKTEIDVGAGLEIIARDGRALFSVRETGDGTGIEVSASQLIKDKAGDLYDEKIAVRPRASNVVFVFRLPYE